MNQEKKGSLLSARTLDKTFNSYEFSIGKKSLKYLKNIRNVNFFKEGDGCEMTFPKMHVFLHLF